MIGPGSDKKIYRPKMIVLWPVLYSSQMILFSKTNDYDQSLPRFSLFLCKETKWKMISFLRTFQFQKLRQKFEALQTLFFCDIKLADIHAFCKIFVLSKYAQKQLFFYCELGNARPTKELKAFFAFAENLPTSAIQHVLPQSDLRSFCNIC